MQVVGVDCHKQVHAAVIVDDAGREVGHWRGTNSVAGWQQLVAWAQVQAPGAVWGIEGSGQYGRGLAQQLVGAGVDVREVNPRLSAAMRRGSRSRSKSDRLDALAIARVIQQDADSLPTVQVDDATAVLAVLVAARDGLVAEITALRNQLHQHLVQLAPVQTAPWPRLTVRQEVERLVTYSVTGHALVAAHAAQVRLLAARIVLAMTQAEALGREIAAASAGWTAPLQAIVGVGPLTAGMLAAHLGGKTFADDAALAMYAGVAPLEASSGACIRHRLNRTGNRQLNAVLHRIALSQSRASVQGRAYLAKKQAEGKSRTEAFRCLKRLLARFVLTAWKQCGVPTLADVTPALT